MTEAQAAHLRLISSLPIRTHERAHYQADDQRRANNSRAVSYLGIQYDSVTAAARALGICRESMYLRLKLHSEPGRGRKPIMVMGKKYPGFRIAWQTLGKSPNTIHRWLKNDPSKARYL